MPDTDAQETLTERFLKLRVGTDSSNSLVLHHLNVQVRCVFDYIAQHAGTPEEQDALFALEEAYATGGIDKARWVLGSFLDKVGCVEAKLECPDIYRDGKGTWVGHPPYQFCLICKAEVKTPMKGSG